MMGVTLVHEFLGNLPGGAIAPVVVMAVMFVLGFLDTFEPPS